VSSLAAAFLLPCVALLSGVWAAAGVLALALSLPPFPCIHGGRYDFASASAWGLSWPGLSAAAKAAGLMTNDKTRKDAPHFQRARLTMLPSSNA
jgi:hypothetical protein